MLPVSSHGRPSVCVCVLVASYEDASHVGSGPTLVTSCDLNHLFKDPVSGVRASIWEFVGDGATAAAAASH